MYQSINIIKKAKVIIYFIDEKVEKGPQSLTILDQTQLITTNQNKYEFQFEDKSLNVDKIYECFLQYESVKVSYYIKVNFGRDNYYFFGRKKSNMSLECIFFDFLNKNIDNDRCYIKYNGKKYYANNDTNFMKLRNLNLINIDMNLLELPLSYENKAVSADTFNDTSYSLSISVAEKVPKIFGIFLNKPFLEIECKLTAKEIVSKLQTTLNIVQSILNYDVNKTIKEYSDGIVYDKLPTIYVNEIRNSLKLEQEILPFFNFYRPNLTEDEILAFETYSEFMITFPSFKYRKRDAQSIVPFQFQKQHYFSHKVIENFMKTVPLTLSQMERTYLKYSACRGLRNLLLNDLALYKDKLFYFCDLNEPGTLYNEAKKFNETFIDELTENSEMFLFFLQINSGSSINKLTNVLTTKFSMLTIDQIKEHLRNSLPNYIIRIDCHSDFKGLTFNESKCTIVSEIDLFGHFLIKEELKEVNLDDNYNKRLILSNVLQQERFGHLKLSSNFCSFKSDKGNINNLDDFDDEPLSPKQYYFIKNEGKERKEILTEIVEEILDDSGKIVTIGESGYAFNVFLTRGEAENMYILRLTGADFSKIFIQPKLFASEDLTDLNLLIRASGPQIKLPENKSKKELKGKYVYSREKLIYRDCMPTIAKYF